MNKIRTKAPSVVRLTAVAAEMMLLGAGQATAKGVTDADIVNDATITTQGVTHGLGTKGKQLHIHCL